jgi:putative Mg2+ transporter-C (MgtC) family protein
MNDLMQSLLHTHLGLGEITLRFTAASVLALLIGGDRELRSKAAGLRTHMLVSLASAAFVILTLELAHAAGSIGEGLRLDPIRAVEAAITGIAFLGAGAIIQSRGSVHGITTGASIWLSGAIGLACGIGSFAVAGLLTLFGFVILALLLRLEPRPRAGDPH